MIAVDYRADRGSTYGFSFYVSLSVNDDRLAAALKAVVRVNLDESGANSDNGWSWDGRAAVWIVRRWAWAEFMAALRAGYPDDLPAMTPRAESAAIEEFVDRTLSDDVDQQAWAIFGLRTDAHWSIVIVAVRAVAWSHLESIKTGKQAMQLTPFSARKIVIAFTKLHRTYGEPQIPGDVVDLLRRLAGTVEDLMQSTLKAERLIATFAEWERRMATKIIRAGKRS